jgi:hypothetical protein
VSNSIKTPGQCSSYGPFGLYLAGQVEIEFQYLLNWPPFDRRETREGLRSRLNRIPGVELPADRLDARPSFRIEILENEAHRGAFLSAMEWCLAEIMKAGGGPVSPDARGWG